MKHIARKRFGQNFLIDQSVIADIVAAIGVDDQDVTVEIGPGLGALTLPLLEAVTTRHSAPLHVVELDRDLVARLQGKARGGDLIVHQGDALDFDFGALAAPEQRLRLVGNLPYNISSPLLFHLVQWASRVRDQHFMLQREVVERMTAVPGDGAFGRLSVMLQVHYQMSNLFEVPPQAFDPPPKVFSAIVRMIPDARLSAQILDHRQFGELVTQAFSQRRKMLRNTLARYASLVPFEAAEIEPTARAEDIAPQAYVRYANMLTNSASL